MAFASAHELRSAWRCAVRGKVNDYLLDVLTWKGREVALKAGGRPPGLLKALHDKYGQHLDDLRHSSALHHITVDYRR